MSILKFHELANLFPLIEGAEFEALKEDIHQNGLREDIVVFEGKIIDGRNRYRAMIALDLRVESFIKKMKPSDFIGGALAWVLSKNLHRRHLSESQRAMVAGNIANMKSGERTDIAQNAKAEPSANLPKVSNSKAAEKLKVSERSVRSAKKVLEQGSDQLQKAVTSGDIKVSAAAEIAQLPEEEQIAVIENADPKALAKVVKKHRAEKQLVKKQKREQREKELGQKQIALPDARFGVIYADPEWQFENYCKNTGMDRSADNHYPTSSLETIKARKIADIAAKDCILFLWATSPMLPQALEVMSAWGFEYKSQFIWLKNKIGTGFWSRNKHEILLVGTKGNVPAPAMGEQWESVVEADVKAHSQKPDKFYELVENYFPTLPKIELNARKARLGWDSWGLEAPEEGEDTGDVKPLTKADERIDNDTATATQKINKIISQGYKKNLALEQIATQANISKNAVQKRAKRLGLSNIDRQKQAVIASNKRRAL